MALNVFLHQPLSFSIENKIKVAGKVKIDKEVREMFPVSLKQMAERIDKKRVDYQMVICRKELEINKHHGKGRQKMTGEQVRINKVGYENVLNYIAGT